MFRIFFPSLLYITIILSLASGPVFGQINKLWESRHTERGFTTDAADDIIVDGNGNSFVLSKTGVDANVIKYNNEGQLLWSFEAGRGVFMESTYENAYDFKVDAAGNVYLLLIGNTLTDPGTLQIGLIKISSNGKQLWLQSVPAYGAKVSLAVHSDGTCYAFYSTGYSDTALSKFSDTGVLMWTKSYPGTDQQFVQQVDIVDDAVVVWHYVGYPTYSGTSFFHVYETDGTLRWETKYKFQDYGTHITDVRYHWNEFYVAYFNDNSSKAFSEIVRYNASNGEIVNSFSIQMDDTFQNPDPFACMYVGDDDNIYVMGQDELLIKKYSADGAPMGWYRYAPSIFYKYEVLDYVINKEQSAIDVLIKTKEFNGPVSYSVVSFLPTLTNQVIATASVADANFTPTVIAKSGANVYIAGAFPNAIFQDDDLLVAKFSSNNTHSWNAFFTSGNSLGHSPTCITADVLGNVYVAGLLGLTPSQYGFGIIKYDSKGHVLWVKKLAPDELYGSQAYRTMATAIAVNSSGDVFVTGVIKVEAIFDNIAEPVEMYTIKLDANGNTLWTAKTSGEQGDYLTGFQIALDQDNNVYVLGSNHNVDNSMRNTMVLLKYDNSGNQKWEKRFSVYTDYTGYASTLKDTDVPKMKIVNNEIFVLNNGTIPDNGIFYNALELRKFDKEGNETIIRQIKDNQNLQISAQDFCFNGNDDILIMYNQYYSSSGSSVPYDYQTHVMALSSTGETLWDKTWTYDIGNYPSNGAVAVDQLHNIYAITATNKELIYSKLSSKGNVIWSKNEVLKGYDNNYGLPVFVFAKKNNNPVFMSTNKNDSNSKYFFFAERDNITGEIVQSETFDEVYDTSGDIQWFRPGDQLKAFCKSDNSDDFIITGVIEDKYRRSETVVTIKYTFDPLDNNNGSGSGGDNGDNGGVTGVEPQVDGGIILHPTLTKGLFKIEGLTMETKSVILFDSFGRLVCTLIPNDQMFDITSVSSGCYLVRVLHKNAWHTLKVIKE